MATPFERILDDLRAAGLHPDHVGRRLERQVRLVAKLARFPSMSLSRMQDVAGCRAVVADLARVEAVRQELGQAAMTVSRVIDLNAEPWTSGYRAVHLVVIKCAIGVGIEDNLGPTDVLRSLALCAEDIARLDLAGRSGAADEVVRAARTELTTRMIGSDR